MYAVLFAYFLSLLFHSLSRLSALYAWLALGSSQALVFYYMGGLVKFCFL